jgi:hypothetical protein
MRNGNGFIVLLIYLHNSIIFKDSKCILLGIDRRSSVFQRFAILKLMLFSLLILQDGYLFSK